MKQDWVSSNHNMPPDSKDHGAYSETVEFATNRGHIYTGWFRYDFNEWIVKDKSIAYSRNDVTRWRPVQVTEADPLL